ncbi:MAG TPA: cupin domain-containing protein [Gaiellales bacterium]|jgi:mannose-6-phosphate isomerase-like protein (cupin superfamily)
MSATETGLSVKSFDQPDETRPFAAHGSMAVLQLGETTAGKGIFEPGWRWSQDVKPIAGTDSCQAHHSLYILSGRMHILMEDGTEGELGPGDAAVIPAGHDAWTVGDEPCVAVDFTGVARYAKPA